MFIPDPDFFHTGSGSATLIKKSVRAEMRKSTGRLRRGMREGGGADPEPAPAGSPWKDDRTLLLSL
jgi:hypothetical protein